MNIDIFSAKDIDDLNLDSETDIDTGDNEKSCKEEYLTKWGKKGTWDKYPNMGDISDYERWDADACTKLALAIGAEMGKKYKSLYIQYLHATDNAKITDFQNRYKGIERLLSHSCVGAIIDTEEMCNTIRYKVYKEYYASRPMAKKKNRD